MPVPLVGLDAWVRKRMLGNLKQEVSKIRADRPMKNKVVGEVGCCGWLPKLDYGKFTALASTLVELGLFR